MSSPRKRKLRAPALLGGPTPMLPFDGIRSRGKGQSLGNVSPTTSTTRASVLNVRSNTNVTGDSYSESSSSLTINIDNSSPRVEQLSSRDLKTTKFSVLLNEKAKRKGRNNAGEGKNDVRVESVEFQLLVKLFIPPLHLIRNDKMSVKQLSNYLPILINGTLPKLNFELHLFLISIVTNYVSSWYKKLNTDNLEFIQHVYKIICDFVKNASKRISSVVELYELVSLIDSMAGVLDNHLQQFLGDDDECSIKVVNEYNERVYSDNVIMEKKTSLEIITDFLASQHVIFDSQLLEKANDENLNYYNQRKIDSYFDNTLDSESIIFHSPAQKEQPHLVYFRILVKKILLETFNEDGPTSSVITMNLIIFLLSDLVLDKVFKMLASPTFILEIIDKIVDSLLQESKQSPKPKAAWGSINSYIASGQNYINSLISKLSGIFPSSPHPNDDLNILDSSIFSLFNTIFNVSGRKPLLFNLVSATKSVISSSTYLTSELNSRIKQFLCFKIRSSGALKDESLANVVRTLKQSLFLDEDKAPTPSIDIDELTEKIFALTRVRLPLNYPLISYETFYFQGETDEDFKAAIKRVLLVFNYETDQGACDLNRLLVVQWLDVIISFLYPELVL